MSRLSHYDRTGAVSMVDVGSKPATRRSATARAFVKIRPEVLKALPDNPKGNPLEVARIAGIQAAKKTFELVPLCHPLPLSHANVATELREEGVLVTATASTVAATGVEMEAMTAAAIASLTVYDMCKALDKSIEIREIVLVHKTGGKSGTYQRHRA